MPLPVLVRWYRKARRVLLQLVQLRQMTRLPPALVDNSQSFPHRRMKVLPRLVPAVPVGIQQRVRSSAPAREPALQFLRPHVAERLLLRGPPKAVRPPSTTCPPMFRALRD